MHSRKQEQHLQMSWGERVWCAHGTHKGSRVAGSGEWGWNGGRVGRAQQCRVFGPCHSTGFMQKVCAYLCVCTKSLQLCLTLWNSMDWSRPGSPVHGILQNTGAGCHFLLQGIFLTQGLNPSLLCLLHWQADSLLLHHLL